MPIKQEYKKWEREQEWKFYSNLRTNPADLWKNENSFLMSVRILNSQVWAQSPTCDMLTKRKNYFPGICLLFSLFQRQAVLRCFIKSFSKPMCPERHKFDDWWKSHKRDFLNLFFKSNFEKPNDWERAWFILCECWSVCLTVAYCILQEYLFKSSPKWHI